MTRYFFDFRQNGNTMADTVGCEFEAAEDAYLEAFKAALEMWPGLLQQRQDPRRCYFEIRDESGNVLFMLPFGEVLESCQDQPARQFLFMETFRKSLETVSRVKQARNEFVREMEKSREMLRESAALIAARL